ncbi:rab GTPase-binding effector protein 1 isoform X1 [Leptidea sinapis]|uniref:rab GTPase-binding effector protein 1 isoform X1 n=1 Tax=Leptidea sinapis TaxID=189913 RepID=UPI002127BEB3|nr:rab GTPase-binding effector protein 1 isoform X1 [Leptidea sinapis]
MAENVLKSSESGTIRDADDSGCSTPDESRRNLEEEFNVQRAKMKELFLQKEDNLKQLVQEKQQLESELFGVRAQLEQLQTLTENQRSEIQSLQMLVSETLEASSSSSEELRRLRSVNLDLEQKISQLKSQEVSLAPATLVRSLARKLGADHEDTPARKNVEDSELVRSIVEPLEAEIGALKTKLRDTDARLQETLKSVETKEKTKDITNSGGDGKVESGLPQTEGPSGCDMCVNYERQLVTEQSRANRHRDDALRAQRALRSATEELEGVRSIHDETVRGWQAERAESGRRVHELEDALRAADEVLRATSEAAERASQRALDLVTTLTVDRETLQKRLDSLERDNATLIGKYTRKAVEIQNEVINLPDTVIELQEQCLQLRDQLIVVQLGREEALASAEELRNQLLQHSTMLHQQDAALAAARAETEQLREQVDKLQTERSQITEIADNLRKSTMMVEQLTEEKQRLMAEAQESRSRVYVLQQELDNSEKVQQDFVRLSQSLQIQLQRIREADTEVRWQHDDDVTECPSCKTPLPNNKKKVHCRHCGRIYCSACVCRSVPSGPRGTPARVCSVCDTLLRPHTAPYFSTAPPHSPD